MSKSFWWWLAGSAALLLIMTTGAYKPVLEAFLKQWEGFRSRPYWDKKQWSWGYGTRVPNSTADPNKNPGGTITPERALADMGLHFQNDYNYLKGLLHVPLTANQWAAYLSFAYNEGQGNADNLIANLNAWNLSALETQWKKYIYAGGEVDPNLVARRAAEWKLFTT